MAITLGVPSRDFELKPRITVVGTGGAGGNAVNNMIRANLEGVDFVVANTDSQALSQSICTNRIQLGTNITRGLGAGSRPDIGAAAAEEAIDEIMEFLHGSNMVFVTAGMGGGTGTGAAPVIARAARECGILTIGVITKPFHFEGAHRMRLAEKGIADLQQVVDTLIIIPNQNLFRVANERTTMSDAFKMADDVLHSGVRGITDLMVVPGLVNLDFADIRTVMVEMGKAMMGTGEAEGEGRAQQAAEAAISNPLLDDVSMKGARGVLINITGGSDITLYEIDEAANRIRQEVDPDANIIFGSTFDENMEGKIRLSIVATGIDTPEGATREPLGTQEHPSTVAAPAQQQGYHYQKSVRRLGMPSTVMKPSMRAPSLRPSMTPAPAVPPTSLQQPAAKQADGNADDSNTAQTHAQHQDTAQATPPASSPQRSAAHQKDKTMVKGGVFIAASAMDADLDLMGDGDMDERATNVPATPHQRHQQPVKSSSLFGRMVAAATGTPQAAPKPQEHQRANPQDKKVTLVSENPQRDSSLDIPAFLRRQAN